LHSFDRLELAGNERWFLVRTAPKSERRAQFHLNAQGFRTHAPWILKTVRHARQFRSVHAPLFPGYLFIILDLGRDRWLCVRSTVGVASVICRDNRPLPVPAGIVEGLIAQTDATNVTRLDSGLAPGAPVRILSGPFAQLVGTLERLDDAGRVRVLLDIMGTAVPVALQRAALAPAV
jgi:transcription elongation factor/antiterminator RfaH